jgi:hypothetical protein
VGEFTVVPLLTGFLRSLYSANALEPMLATDVKGFKAFAGEEWKKFNLVLLGGPLTNEYTRQALEGIQPKHCSFVPGTHAIQLPKTILEPPADEDGSIEACLDKDGFVVCDYGLFYRAPSSFDENARVYIFAGTLTHGTSGALSAAFSAKLVPVMLQNPEDGVCEAVIRTQRNKMHDHERRTLAALCNPQERVSNPADLKWTEEVFNPAGLNVAWSTFLVARRMNGVQCECGDVDFAKIEAEFLEFQESVRGLTIP